MNDVVSTFPLLRLPIDAILHTTKIMNPGQIFGMSLLSKKTKNLVKSLKLSTKSFQVVVTDHFKINLSFFDNTSLSFIHYPFLKNVPPQELEAPGLVDIFCESSEGPELTWKHSMSIKQLLDQLQFIYRTSITALYFKDNSEGFSLESIHRNLKEIGSVLILTINAEHNRRILCMFKPATFELTGSVLIDACIPRNVLIRNCDGIRARNVQITLNDLLASNSRLLLFKCDELSSKLLNNFLKLWSKGANPRLECLILQFHSDLQIEDLFTGLKYQEVPLGRVRLFKTSGLKHRLKFTGGRDIWRVDGTQATISVDIKDGLVSLGMSVWHDHCVGN